MLLSPRGTGLHLLGLVGIALLDALGDPETDEEDGDWGCCVSWGLAQKRYSKVGGWLPIAGDDASAK